MILLYLIVLLLKIYIILCCTFMLCELVYQSKNKEIIISEILYNSWILILKELIIDSIYNIFKSFKKPWRWK